MLLPVRLLPKADGSKFGKSEKGNIWLDAAKTSPYEFYQFWLNTSDADATRYIKIFTFLTPEEIATILEEHAGNEHNRTLQKRLAEEVTAFVHGKENFSKAVQATALLFSKDTLQIISTLSKDELDAVLTGVPAMEVSKEQLETSPDIVSFLADASILQARERQKK
jgi:tyrosyl-tRNA synthetase